MTGQPIDGTATVAGRLQDECQRLGVTADVLRSRFGFQTYDDVVALSVRLPELSEVGFDISWILLGTRSPWLVGAPPAAPAPAVTPLPAGVAAMWDAASLAGLGDGAAVTSWTDGVGGAVARATRDSRVANLFVLNSGNGLPAVRLSGSSVLATSGDNAANTAMSGSERSMVVIARNFRDPVGTSDGDNYQFNAGLLSSGNSTTVLIGDTGHTGAMSLPVPAAPAGIRTISYAMSDTLEAQGNPGQGIIGINGTAIGAQQHPATGQVFIGGWQDRAHQCCGKADILAVIIFARMLTAADIKQIHRRYCELSGQARPGGASARHVTCIGDSLTFGYLNASNTAVDHFQASYPYQMAQGLGLDWGTWDNLGYGGDNLPNVLTRLVPSVGDVSAVTGQKSIVCFFEFANTNNAIGGAAKAREIIDALHSQDPNRVVAFGTATDEQQTAETERAAYCAHWDDDANQSGIAAYAQLHLDPNIGVSGAAPASGGSGNTYYQPDGTHLTTAGYGLLDNGPRGFRAAVRTLLAA